MIHDSISLSLSPASARTSARIACRTRSGRDGQRSINSSRSRARGVSFCAPCSLEIGLLDSASGVCSGPAGPSGVRRGGEWKNLGASPVEGRIIACGTAAPWRWRDGGPGVRGFPLFCPRRIGYNHGWSRTRSRHLSHGVGILRITLPALRLWRSRLRRHTKGVLK